MGQEIKSIRKQFRITRQEEKQIKEMMREQKVDSFSEFLRQNLLKKKRIFFGGRQVLSKISRKSS